MKKTTLILIGLGASVGMAMHAAPLTPAEALQRSRLSSPAKVQGMADSSPVLGATVRHEGTPAIYIFNKADNKGFMVLSADDTSVPVLGYCDQGQIPSDASQMPDGLSYWLQCLAEDVSLNASAGGKVFVKPTAQTAKASIAPSYTPNGTRMRPTITNARKSAPKPHIPAAWPPPSHRCSITTTSR